MQHRIRFPASSFPINYRPDMTEKLLTGTLSLNTTNQIP